jgi:hypothetical protein
MSDTDIEKLLNEIDKWKRPSRQIVDVLLVHSQLNTFPSSIKSLLDIYSTQLTLFDVVSSVTLRPIDPFVITFRMLSNRNLCFVFSNDDKKMILV